MAKLVLVKNTSSVAHPRLNKNRIVDKGILIFSYKKLVHKNTGSPSALFVGSGFRGDLVGIY